MVIDWKTRAQLGDQCLYLVLLLYGGFKLAS